MKAIHPSFRLTDTFAHLRVLGTGEVLPKELGKTERTGETLVWDPGVEGLLVGEAEMTVSSRHNGERHLDGDELVCLVAGTIRVAIEDDTGRWTELHMQPGDSLLIPQSHRHRLLVDEPSRVLFVSTGRTEIRPPSN